jgi:YrbI family 3-deoxy-D-manno-octulosonate 8-phosphate phosphatase
VVKGFTDKLPTLIVYDFDGVMTDNRVLVSETGEESAVVNRSDGLAISFIREQLGIAQLILSTEKNPLVKRRGEKLGIEVIHGVSDKAGVLLEYTKSKGISLADTLMIGNDLNDLAAMSQCGYSCCPQDAEMEVLDAADLVLTRRGGEGVVRELYRLLAGGTRQ